MKTIVRSSEVATRVKKTADICGVTPRTVYMVIFGTRVNDKVLRVYMHLKELDEHSFNVAKKTALVKEVEKTVPLN